MTYPPANPFGGAPFGAPAQSGPPVYTTGHPSQRPANSLATVALVFAFVFAPAGAVLGHLSLSQIARTGERGRDRALIALIVSYVVIVAVVIGLVSWAADDHHAGRATRSAAPGPQASATTLPPSDPGSIRAPLLSVDEVEHLLLNPLPGAPKPPPVTGFAATSAFTGPLSTGALGRVNPPACEPTFFAGTGTALAGSGFRTVVGASMQGAGPYVPEAVTEVVATYADSATLQQAIAGYVAKVAQCPEAKRGRFDVTGPDGSSNGEWIGATGAGEPHTIAGMTFYHIHTQQFRHADGSVPIPSGDFYTSTHIIASKGPALIDVTVSGTGLFFQGLDVARAIAAKIG